MKNILYIICTILALTACSKEEFGSGAAPTASHTFNIGIEEPADVSQTKAPVKMGRYLLEMYEGGLEATPVRLESADGVFNVDLKREVDYVCLFWADGGAGYDASDLKAVKQADETVRGGVAYCASVTVNSNSFNGDVTLKRAVAELSFIDNIGLDAEKSTLQITYPYASAMLNVGDGTVTYAAGSTVRTIADIPMPARPTDAFASDYVLAPTEAGSLAGLKLQINDQAQKTIAAAAVRANYRTKISGEYQKAELKVGSFYYDDNTFSNVYNTWGGARTCLGIVFYVNPDGKSGKMVKAQSPQVDGTWGLYGLEETVEGIYDTDNGAPATKNMIIAHKDDEYFRDLYSGFDQLLNTVNGGDVDGRWYFPAIDELQHLYCAFIGVAPTTWAEEWPYPNPPTDADAKKEEFNNKLQAAGGAKIFLNGVYWSSTQYDEVYVLSFSFGKGSWDSSSGGKLGTNPFVVISTF